MFLKEKLPEWLSRTQIQKAIKEGLVTVDGETRKPSYSLKTGETVEVLIPQKVERTEIKPEPIQLDVLYEDGDVIVINKPAGLLVHPTATKNTGTLVNALLFHCDDLQGIGGEHRPGIVHRLDRETSGVMVVAKNDLAHMNLSIQFKKRTVYKEYLAITKGASSRTEWIVTAGIKRHPYNRLKMLISENGKPSETWFRVLKRFADAAMLVAAYPKSGRTHQIRLHLKHAGYPILGDYLYARNVKIEGLEVPRLMLHAVKLAFHHPRSGEKLEFTARLPEDFKKVLRRLADIFSSSEIGSR